MDYKEKIVTFMKACAENLKVLVTNAVISCSAKMIYRNLNRIVDKALNSFTKLRESYDSETNEDKKQKKLVGLTLGSNCLKQFGEALIDGAKILVEGLPE